MHKRKCYRKHFETAWYSNRNRASLHGIMLSGLCGERLCFLSNAILKCFTSHGFIFIHQLPLIHINNTMLLVLFTGQIVLATQLFSVQTNKNTNTQTRALVIIISAVSRGCETSGTGNSCQKQDLFGIAVDYCLCNTDLCNGASRVYVTSGLMAAAVIMAVKLLL